MSKYHTDCYGAMKSLTDLFPIEVDLTPNMLDNANLNQGNYSSMNDYTDSENEDDFDQKSNQNYISLPQSPALNTASDEKLIDF
jgi:hypothetical protein